MIDCGLGSGNDVLLKHKIILIGGKAGSGKDTVGNYLVNNYKFTRFAYADALKDYVSLYYNVNRKLFDTQESKMTEIIINGKKTTPRQMLIDTSLEKKKENELIWVEKVIGNIINCENKYIVITDFRFDIEYIELYKRFYDITTINIKRDKALNINDISETSLKEFKFDYIIENNGSIEELHEKIVNLL